MGAARRVPNWDEDQGQFVPVMEANLTLSFDHRVLDGGAAGRLLAHISRLLARPEQLYVPLKGERIMLTELQLKNFKIWKDTKPVKMAPLTVLFGTNSSGKSSIEQFFLMLKQTMESSNRKIVIYPGDVNTPVNLGSFEELVFARDPMNKLEFNFEMEPGEAAYGEGSPVRLHLRRQPHWLLSRDGHGGRKALEIGREPIRVSTKAGRRRVHARLDRAQSRGKDRIQTRRLPLQPHAQPDASLASRGAHKVLRVPG